MYGTSLIHQRLKREREQPIQNIKKNNPYMENRLSSFALSCIFFLSFFNSIALCLGAAILNSDTDRHSLIFLKNSITSDPNAILRTKWSENTSVCNWIGVTCGLRHQRVTALNLSGFDLTGIVAPHLGNLTFLRYLDISSNNFTGFLPFELSKLRRLKVVNVGVNSFTGDIPIWLGSLHEVEQVYLHNNSFSGMIPPSLFNSSKLQLLEMSFNMLSENIPKEIGSSRSSSLKEIRISSNNLSGNIPEEIGNISSLQILLLNNNHLSGSIPEGIFNMSSLRNFRIMNNSLSGSLPTDLCNNLPNIESLAISTNQLSGEIPANIWKCKGLEILSLSTNYFSGEIPSEIGRLSMLRELYLSENDLRGAIPPEIGNLSRLEILNIFDAFPSGIFPYSVFNMSSLKSLGLGKNNLSGWLPHDICSNNMLNIKELYLHENRLEGQIPPNIWKCKNLELLKLSDNTLSGGIPPEIGNMSMLRELYLHSNFLKGELPLEIGALPNLQIFGAFNNSLSGSIPTSLFNISTLTSLELSLNEFSGTLPSDMGHSLPNLEMFFLIWNRISGPIPTSITNASKLTNLELSANSFTGSIPNFGNLRLLKVLRLWENNLTSGAESPTQESTFLSSLTNCRYLEDLQIDDNPLNDMLPASIGNFSDSLKYFTASNCSFNGVIPFEIGNLSSLSNLNLGRNQLSGPIPPTVGKLKKLQRLYLDGNQLVGSIPNDLCRLKNLGELGFQGNMLMGPIPECLGEVKSLRELFLDSNQLNSTIPPNLWTLTDLVALNLSSNYFTGQLSSQLGNLKAIISLGLSFNQLVGDIPNSIDGCQSVEFLYFSNNLISGSIPQSLGNIKGLITLDLSHNDLSGSIPNSLEDLPFLEHFNVSNNKLEGKIPDGGRFVNFTAQSFSNNFALCGSTRFQVQPCPKIDGGSRENKIVRLIKYILPSVILLVIARIALLVFIRRRKQKDVTLSADVLPAFKWRRISYIELERGTGYFSESNLLGRGSYGSVYGATLLDGLKVAVKVFSLQQQGAVRSFDTETQLMSSIRHRNLVRVIGCCSNIEFKALILTYMPNGGLDKWLYSENICLDLMQRLKIAIDVAAALEYLHHGYSFTVVHCDVKPSNVLLDEDMTAHLSDFGISKLFEGGEAFIHTQTLATIGYAAPELGTEGKVSTKGDVYSFGIMMLEMFTGKKPTDDMFSGEMSLIDWTTEAVQENAAFEIMAPALLSREDQYFSAKEQCVSSIFHLAMKCLAVSAGERINMTEATTALRKIKETIVAVTVRRPRRS